MAERSSISVAIINYRGFEDLPALFDSLEGQTLAPREVIFIDNDSQDESADWVERNLPHCTLIRQARNDGYARAGNLAVRRSSGDFVLILNTDLELDCHCLEELSAAALPDPSVAAVATKLLLRDAPTILNGVGGAMNRLGYTWDRGMFEKDAGQYDKSEPVIFACGGAALFRRSAFLQAGGFDRRFFMYHEDVDLCWRFWLLGWRVITAPGARVFHKFSGSTRVNMGLSWREVLGERNNMRSLLKNYELGNAIWAIRTLMRQPQHVERSRFRRRNLLWNLAALPDTLIHRLRIQKRRQRSDSDLRHLITQQLEVPVDLSRLSSVERQTGMVPRET